jgi:hypothetical protein
MANIGTLTTGAGVVTTFTLTYCPQYIIYVAATALTGVKVTVMGTNTITDLDANGTVCIGQIRQYGRVTNGYMIPLATGFIPGKNVELVFTNSAAQTPVIYANSLRNGEAYFSALRLAALANSMVQVENFSFLGLPAAATGDNIIINYVDGLTQKVQMEELLAIQGLYQNDLNTSAAKGIDNIDGMIDSVQFTGAAAQTIYPMRIINA